MPFNIYLFTQNAFSCDITLMYISSIISLKGKEKTNTKPTLKKFLVVLKFHDFGQRTEKPGIKDFRPVRSFLQ